MIAAGAVAIDAGPAVDVLTGGVDATAAEPPDPAVMAVDPGSSRGKVRTPIVHVSALGSDTLPRQSVESDASRGSCTAMSASRACWATTSNG